MATSSPICPPWCTARHHRPDDLIHARDIAELGPEGFAVEVQVTQHVQPGHVGAETVNVFAHTVEETELILLVPELAASLGHVLLKLDDHGRRELAVALVDAAAVLLMSRSITPATSGSTIEREVPPHTPNREAVPNGDDADGR
ncbi:hypothetical protein [Nonomuraea sp. NPDC002799]